jgi:hypothetical protein
MARSLGSREREIVAICCMSVLALLAGCGGHDVGDVVEIRVDKAWIYPDPESCEETLKVLRAGGKLEREPNRYSGTVYRGSKVRVLARDADKFSIVVEVSVSDGLCCYKAPGTLYRAGEAMPEGAGLTGWMVAEDL